MTRCANTWSPVTSPVPRSTSSPSEPKTAGDQFVSSLQGIPNVILTPHVGGSTEEAQQDIGRFVAGKLRDFASAATRRCRSTCRRCDRASAGGPGC